MKRITDDQTEARLVSVVPSERQIRHQKMEFYAFVHFTVNTFTGKEWGDGTEDPAIFNPEKLDADQWVQALKAAGMPEGRHRLWCVSFPLGPQQYLLRQRKRVRRLLCQTAGRAADRLRRNLLGMV